MRYIALVIVILIMLGGILFAQASEFYEANERGKTDARLDLGSKGVGVGVAAGGIGGVLLGAIGGSIGVLGSYVWSSGATVEVSYYRIQQLEQEGKSGNFINTYRNAYQAESKKILNKNALTGSVGGCIVGVLIAVVLIAGAGS